jgi:hypothetical protein
MSTGWLPVQPANDTATNARRIISIPEILLFFRKFLGDALIYPL